MKDILNLKNYVKQLCIILIFFTVNSIVLKNPEFAGSMCIFLCSMIVVTSISYDEYTNWNKYALTMNISRQDIVLSKYILLIMSSLLGFILGFISLLVLRAISNQNIDIHEIMILNITFLSVAVLLYSIIIPIIFKLGMEKARIIMVAVFFIPSIIGYFSIEFLNKMNIPMPNLETLIDKFYILPILAIIVVFISFKSSLSIFNKKEF